MKKLITAFCFLTLHAYMFGQVGINMPNPQQTLHVGGSTENVRIEGLNYPNNSNNLGPESTTRVYVNALGNLVLGGINDIPPLLIDSGNYLENQETPENVVIQVGHGMGYTPTASPNNWSDYVFTLIDTAVVEVNYSVSWNIYNQIDDKRKRINDNRARVVHTGMYFMKIFNSGCQTPYCGNPTSVPTCDPTTTSNCYVVKDADDNFINGGPWCIRPVSENNCTSLAGLFALNGQYYTNSESEHGEYKNLRTNGSDYIKLPPGDYLGLFACKLEVEDTGGSGSAKLWLGVGDDELQIRIYYVN